MSYLGTVHFECPYCGAERIRHSVTPEDCRSHLVYCTPEEGGCDRQMVIRISASVTLSAAVSPILWEQDAIYTDNEIPF